MKNTFSFIESLVSIFLLFLFFSFFSFLFFSFLFFSFLFFSFLFFSFLFFFLFLILYSSFFCIVELFLLSGSGPRQLFMKKSVLKVTKRYDKERERERDRSQEKLIVIFFGIVGSVFGFYRNLLALQLHSTPFYPLFHFCD